MPEYFDLYDAHGSALGRSKERAAVHRDGDWHRSIHLWIVRRDARLVFQRRSHGKDTWPDHLTATVSGHYAAGEALADVLREAQEEIGLAVQVADLLPLGLWRSDDAPAAGVIDRELQDVFLWPSELPLERMRPDPVEVAALLDVTAADLMALLEGRLDRLTVPCRLASAAGLATMPVRAAELVPSPDYHLRIARAALDYAAGRRPSLDGSAAGGLPGVYWT